VGFALAAYRADHQRYPDSLSPLTPTYMADLPRDPYTGDELIYRREGAGFLLYSRGPNRRDNQGREPWDRDHGLSDDETANWDDVRLQIPVKEN